MSNILYRIFLCTVLTISFVNNSLAKTKFIGTHKDWTAYSNKEKNGKTCFIASKPLKSSGKYNIILPSFDDIVCELFLCKN